MSVNRSPRYPAVDLAAAIALVEKIFDREGRAPVKEEVAMRHLGYNGLNGASLKVLSALRKYGLVEAAAGGLKVSQDAIVILANRHQQDHPDRLAAIRRAAFRVELFSDLHENFGPEPSEQNLAAQLMVRGFSKDGSVKAARAYRATMALVSSTEGEDDPEADRGSDAAKASDIEQAAREVGPDDHPPKREVPLQPGMRKAVFTLDEGDVTLTFPADLSVNSYMELGEYLEIFLRRAQRQKAAASE